MFRRGKERGESRLEVRMEDMVLEVTQAAQELKDFLRLVKPALLSGSQRQGPGAGVGQFVSDLVGNLGKGSENGAEQ